MNFNKKDPFDSFLYDSLHIEQTPDESLDQETMLLIKERMEMKRKKSYKVAVAAAVCILGVSAIGVGAATYFLTPKEAVEELGYQDIADLFEGENAVKIDETKQAGEYNFTLMGLAEGKDFLSTDLDSDEIKKDKFYAVVAVSKINGEPLTLKEFDEDTSYFISPLIRGLKPWQYNIASMGGFYTEQDVNGVVYRMISCDEVSIFSDRHLYLCISDTAFFDAGLYEYDEESGEITAKEGYEGVNLLFDLPLDSKYADPNKAAEYIENMENGMNGNTEDEENELNMEDGSLSSTNPHLEGDYSLYIKNPDIVNDLRTLDEAFRNNPDEVETVLETLKMTLIDEQTVKEKDGAYTFSVKLDDGDWECVLLSENFKDDWDTDWNYSETDQSQRLIYSVFRKNADGTSTHKMYQKEYQK